jgi:hypothetical protein
MDESVDQTMSRSNDEKGADKAAQLRRSQQRERGVLQNDIATAQKKIATLNEERAPIATELRKVEAEVGPIKYIAALIYDDNTDADMLEKAVRWVIILLVIVFDPLAIMMLLAATESMKWERAQPAIPKKQEETDDAGKLDDNVKPDAKDMGELDAENSNDPPLPAPAVGIPPEHWGGQDLTAHIEKKDNVEVTLPAEEIVDEETDAEKLARRTWKESNPDDTIHRQKQLLDEGKISRLPWEDLMIAQADDVAPFADVNFGTKFPSNPNRGDAYIRVDYLPTKLFKWNGIKWIEIDKNVTDTFAYNDEYIDHLIAKIGSGEYDPDLLNTGERDQIEQRLRNNNSTGKQ